MLIALVTVTATLALTDADVKNAEVCLPAIGDGPDRTVQLKDAKFSDDAIPFAEMRATAFGRIGGEPAAVAEIVWNTGGSGNWEVVARFARANGKVVCRGIYSPGPDLPDGGTMVGRIEIKDGRILLYGSDPLHHRTIDKPLVVAPDKFIACKATTIDEELRATLVQMGKDDQEAIRIATADPSRAMTDAESTQSNELNRRNQDLIKKIVAQHGWPGISLAGEDGSSAAWLVVQHMDGELEFQKSCLALMKEAFDAGDVLPRNFAYLTDRVLTHEGKRQMYGTQSIGVLSPEDEARVDTNRAAIGLPPWREAVEKRKKDYANGYGGAKKP